MAKGKLEIKKMATAGSVESNDILIMISQGEGDIEIELESVVEKQFGEDIKNVIRETLIEEGITDAKVIAKDKGALDFTIKARVRACVQRGVEA
ncbi:MAG: citrate lyase acyl carrier protein [Tissierellaceae bacterium]|jgi:citrate lyase subunit gamma (acyl carrier protein)|nr:citrate lyase acyl carrier protein [Tissierellia bacterium]